MKKKILIGFLACILGAFVGSTLARSVSRYEESRAMAVARQSAIDTVIASRREAMGDNKPEVDPFGEDGEVTLLLIGLDTRAGQREGHCDAIQFVRIDQREARVDITAIPRGTYSPLPPQTGTTSSDYYVSNACALGGLDYGVKQIERIIGESVDHIVVVGFSEFLDILRSLRLPTTDTLQWLRMRQGYAIGEPQRARNHSTFLKNLLVRFVPTDMSFFDVALARVLYRLVQTDVSFAETRAILTALSTMDLSNHPERVRLSMRPAYAVEDIPYDPERVDEEVAKTLSAILPWLSDSNYRGEQHIEFKNNLLSLIEGKHDDEIFVTWAFEHQLWLQLEDDTERWQTYFFLLEKYLYFVSDQEEKKAIVGDYIVEMQDRGESIWAKRGSDLLTMILGV